MNRVKKYEVIVKGPQQILTYLSKTQGGLTMVYKDKEYKEVLDGSAEVGDLVHVTKLDNVPLDFYALITRFDTEGDKRLDSLLPDNTDFLIDDDDTDFKVYRYVEDVKDEAV